VTDKNADIKKSIINMNLIQGGDQPQLNINLADAPYMECEECQGKIFEEKMMIKKVSRFMTGSDQDSIVPIPVICCAKCGHVNKLFKPKV